MNIVKLYRHQQLCGKKNCCSTTTAPATISSITRSLYASPQDDWLRDIELYSEEFRADYYSILMGELNINPSPVMRRTVKLYATFFGNKDRVAKLRKIGREYQTPLQLHIDIMAVLRRSFRRFPRRMSSLRCFSAGLDEENNDVLNNIKKFGNIEAFWQLVRKYTGFIHEEDKPLGFFASHVLLTALAQTMNPSVLKGLERFISESNRAYCYSIVHEWRNGGGQCRALGLVPSRRTGITAPFSF